MPIPCCHRLMVRELADSSDHAGAAAASVAMDCAEPGARAEQSVVQLDEPAGLLLPSEVIEHALAAAAAENFALVWIVHQPVDETGELRVRSCRGIEGRVAGRHAILGQVEGHHRLRHRHVFHGLDRRAAVVVRIAGVGRGGEVERRDAAEQFVAHDKAGELDVLLQVEFRDESFEVFDRRAAADDDGAEVFAVEFAAKDVERADQAVDAVLDADHADVADHEAAVAEPRQGLDRLEEAGVGAVADDEAVFRCGPAPSDLNFALCLVRGDQTVGEAEGPAFERMSSIERTSRLPSLPRFASYSSGERSCRSTTYFLPSSL